MLTGKYAAHKSEISQIIANLFIQLEEPTEEELQELTDAVVIKGITYNENKGELQLLPGDIFIFKGEQEDIIALRRDKGIYGNIAR